MSPEYRATFRKSQIITRSNIRNKHPLRLVSLALALLSVCLSIAIIGTAADAYSIYKSQVRALNPWWLPLWPGHFDTRGTKSLIGAAAGVVLLNGSFIALCLVPKVSLNVDIEERDYDVLTVIAQLSRAVFPCNDDRSHAFDSVITDRTCEHHLLRHPQQKWSPARDNSDMDLSFLRGRSCRWDQSRWPGREYDQPVLQQDVY